MQKTQRTGLVGLEKHGYTRQTQAAVKHKASVSLHELIYGLKPQKKSLTLVERFLLSLQPDLHNVQRCDFKQIDRFNYYNDI